jgi:hypothetical protein
MGLLDNLESLAGGAPSGGHASVASELMNAVQQHPGGLSGILQNFQQNGMTTSTPGSSRTRKISRSRPTRRNRDSVRA